MISALEDLDRVLRGEATGLPALRDGRIELSLRRLAVVSRGSVLLGPGSSRGVSTW